MGGDIHIFDGKDIKTYIDDEVASISTTATVAREIKNTYNIPTVTAPAAGTTGTDVSTLDFDGSSVEGQKIEFDIPDDYDSGNLSVMIVGRGAAAPTGDKVVYWETYGEIVDISGGDVDTIASSNTSTDVLDGSTAIARTTLKTLTAGTFAIGDRVLLNIKRRADLGPDTYDGVDWKLIGIQIQYTSSMGSPVYSQGINQYQDTDETPPGSGTIGTDVDTRDFAVNEELKFTFIVPDNWDEASNCHIRAVFAMSTSESGKTVRIATEGEVVDVSGGDIDALSIINYDIANEMLPTTLDVPRRTVAIRSIPAASMGKGDEITLKIARRTSPASEHSGDWKLIGMTATLASTTPSSPVEATVWETYMDFAGFGAASGGSLSGYRGYPDYAGDFQDYWVIACTTGTTVTLPISFVGRLSSNQTEVSELYVPLKGSSTNAQYTIRVYMDGGGASDKLAEGIQSASASLAERAFVDTDFSAQPTGTKKRFFVDILATLDTGETLYIGRPFAKLG